MGLCFILGLSVYLSVCRQLHVIATGRIFVIILPQTYLQTSKMTLNFGSRPRLDHEDLKTKNCNFAALFIVYHRTRHTALPLVVCNGLELFIADDLTV